MVAEPVQPHAASLHRLRALLLLVLLVPLQCVAPLLHAHALDDPARVVSSSVHLPGLEALDRSRATAPELRERSFPLIEEADLGRRNVAGVALPPDLPQVRALLFPVHAIPARSTTLVRTGIAGCPPPPSRAPPSLQQS
ncbi:MAG: hypothetical protein ACK5YW_02305 [Betaproteobacteria bacterium]|nr:hypothetical protein [Rhodocyclaceae bacterium]MCA3135845.1 hypothetical protein [Rhodocyclaceae bacterium]MCA3140892.1 hypothetical protein [Rhodocyclaceae bacterium]MCA3147341.1 hypothetical protein [Rhodocyclaceae bacterium]MCE2897155.1 hypothetical protein [Betaproteobacteria bacterium]